MHNDNTVTFNKPQYSKKEKHALQMSIHNLHDDLQQKWVSKSIK